MKFVICLMLMLGFNSFSQDSTLSAFDFWLGEWKAEWLDAQGNKVIGKNTITKELDNKVIREEFVDTTNNFLGTSISVYSLNDSTWHQAWADNAGGYIDLYGIVYKDSCFFQTAPQVQNGTTTIRRMKFYNIQKDSFDWDWQRSTDNGASWQSLWQIHYSRMD